VKVSASKSRQATTSPVTGWSRPRAWTVALLAATVVFGAGVVASHVPASSGPNASPGLPSGASGSTPTTVAGASSPDHITAMAAAVGYASAAQRWLYLTDDQVNAEVSGLATPQAAPRLRDEVGTEVREARKRLGASPGPVWWLVRPLAVKVDRQAGTAMTVSVWLVTVLSAEQVAAPQSEWRTVTVDLEWSGSWLVAAVRDRPGPTPSNGPKDQPWNAAPFAEALTGFTRLDGEVKS
jgi:hypothetical protein